MCPSCLGHGDLCLGVWLSTCRHVPFATDSCLVCYATTVKHIQINQRKASVRLLWVKNYTQNRGMWVTAIVRVEHQTFWCSVLLADTSERHGL